MKSGFEQLDKIEFCLQFLLQESFLVDGQEGFFGEFLEFETAAKGQFLNIDEFLIKESVLCKDGLWLKLDLPKSHQVDEGLSEFKKFGRNDSKFRVFDGSGIIGVDGKAVDLIVFDELGIGRGWVNEGRVENGDFGDSKIIQILFVERFEQRIVTHDISWIVFE